MINTEKGIPSVTRSSDVTFCSFSLVDFFVGKAGTLVSDLFASRVSDLSAGHTRDLFTTHASAPPPASHTRTPSTSHASAPPPASPTRTPSASHTSDPPQAGRDVRPQGTMRGASVSRASIRPSAMLTRLSLKEERETQHGTKEQRMIADDLYTIRRAIKRCQTPKELDDLLSKELTSERADLLSSLTTIDLHTLERDSETIGQEIASLSRTDYARELQDLLDRQVIAGYRLNIKKLENILGSIKQLEESGQPIRQDLLNEKIRAEFRVTAAELEIIRQEIRGLQESGLTIPPYLARKAAIAQGRKRTAKEALDSLHAAVARQRLFGAGIHPASRTEAT